MACGAELTFLEKTEGIKVDQYQLNSLRRNDKRYLYEDLPGPLFDKHGSKFVGEDKYMNPGSE